MVQSVFPISSYVAILAQGVCKLAQKNVKLGQKDVFSFISKPKLISFVQGYHNMCTNF